MQLTTFQDGFAAALLPPPGTAPAHPAWLDALLAQLGFAVYRNTVFKGCIDALQASYPTVCALVGEEWFRAAAGVFAHAQPPHDGLLMAYGAGFAAFLDGFGPAASLPYLGAVARLDRCWTEAHPGGACARARPCVACTADTRSARRPVPAPPPRRPLGLVRRAPGLLPVATPARRSGPGCSPALAGRGWPAHTPGRCRAMGGPATGGRSLSGGLRSRPARGGRRRLRTERRAGRRPVRPDSAAAQDQRTDPCNAPPEHTMNPSYTTPRTPPPPPPRPPRACVPAGTS